MKTRQSPGKLGGMSSLPQSQIKFPNYWLMQLEGLAQGENFHLNLRMLPKVIDDIYEANQCCHDCLSILKSTFRDFFLSNFPFH
jgi:hypothetical protein